MLIHKRYVWLGVLVALGFSVTNANAKTLTFAGEQWVVKNGVAAPGPNNWSEDNVWVDELGQSGRPDLVERAHGRSPAVMLVDVCQARAKPLGGGLRCFTGCG